MFFFKVTLLSLVLFSFQGAISFLLPTSLRKKASPYWVLLVGSSGLEPPTSRLSGVRSNHLSYEPSSYVCRQSLSSSCRVVEMSGIEPLTPCLQGRCSPSCATPPYRTAGAFAPSCPRRLPRLTGRFPLSVFPFEEPFGPSELNNVYFFSLTCPYRHFSFSLERR